MPSPKKGARRGGVAMQAALEVLHDGKWHDLEKIMLKVMQTIPPGKALRHAEELRTEQWKRNNPDKSPPPRRKNLSQDIQIRVGARALAKVALLNYRAFENKDSKIRLVPGKVYYKKDGVWFFAPKESLFNGETPEQAAERRRDISRRGYQTRLRNKGLDPDTPTKTEREAQRLEPYKAMTPEELKAWRSDRVRKSWETRRAKESNAEIPHDGGRRGPQLGDHRSDTSGDH